MAANDKITIKFVPEGDKRLIKAFEGLAKGQRKFNQENKKGSNSLKKYRKNQMRVTKGNQALGGSFAVVRSKMLLFNFAMALGVRQVIGFVKEASKVDSMSRAFNTLAGATENSQVALSKLKSATNDTMSEFDLFQQANNAMILGVSKNSDEMAEMFDIAQRLGRALGRDTKSSVESLITGIGRQSRLMLDNIGIIVKADEAYGKYAKKLGTTADKLTDAQKKQAFLSATMESARKKVASLGEETLSTEDKIAQMDTAISEAANHLGELATPIFLGFAGVISDIAKGVQLIGTTELERLIIKLEEVGASDDLIKGLKVDALNEELVGLNSTLESMIGENAFKEMGGDIQLAQKVMQGMVDKAKENIKLGHKDIAYLKESGTLTEERASKMRQFIKQDEFRIKQSNDVLAIIRKILAVETLLAQKNKQKISGEGDDGSKNENIQAESKFTDDLVKAKGRLLALNQVAFEGTARELDYVKLKVEHTKAQTKIDAKNLSLKEKMIGANEQDQAVIQSIIDINKKAKTQLDENFASETNAINLKHDLIDALKLQHTQDVTNFALQDGFISIAEKKEIAEMKLIELGHAKHNAELAGGEQVLAINTQIAKVKADLINIERSATEQTLAGIGAVTSATTNAISAYEANANAYDNAEKKKELANAKTQRQKDAIEEKYAKKAEDRAKKLQKWKIATAISNVALGITQTWRDPQLPTWAKVIATAAQATAGAAQIATIQGQKFEQGGMVGGRRHSQGGTMIEAEQGEFVMSRNAVNAVGIEAMNRINAGGGAGSVVVNVSGNVMSQDFIEDEAIPMIKEAIRRGADIGVS